MPDLQPPEEAIEAVFVAQGMGEDEKRRYRGEIEDTLAAALPAIRQEVLGEVRESLAVMEAALKKIAPYEHVGGFAPGESGRRFPFGKEAGEIARAALDQALGEQDG